MATPSPLKTLWRRHRLNLDLPATRFRIFLILESPLSHLKELHGQITVSLRDLLRAAIRFVFMVLVLKNYTPPRLPLAYGLRMQLVPRHLAQGREVSLNGVFLS